MAIVGLEGNKFSKLTVLSKSYKRRGKNKELHWEYGIDRIDSNLYYTIDNVVPCCLICNIAKNRMTQQQFKSWIIEAYEYYGKTNE
jgi:hypothetical protein